ncbi:MAG: hypothetical protein Q8861_02025 [Bacteroidota bacterium]|nr:hypothetical protein [Bacteroidota bacterium]
MEETNKQNEQKELCSVGTRIRLYLCDYDEDIWITLPGRVNIGDSFYMEYFVGEYEEKHLKKQTYEDMICGAILTCNDLMWSKNENGIYQLAYLE